MTEDRTDNREKLQKLLRELFQFDAADLDFGIYRILNQRRERIEQFIDHDLLDAVQEGLTTLEAAEAEEVQGRMDDIRSQLGANAFDDEGAVLEKHRDLGIAQEYMSLRQQLQQLEVAEETEARVFNDLHRFFARYYDQGDFLTERRYSSRDPKYAIPYNGEEVLLHWANRDQYYVKTSERFTDYRFRAGSTVVWFRLGVAQEPTDNIKGQDRYFVLQSKDPLELKEDKGLLVVHMEYRALTQAEHSQYLQRYNQQQSKNSQRKTVDRSVLVDVLGAEILDRLDDAGVKADLARPHGEGTDRTELSYHLNRYTARNTMDYFIHKDLGRFLRRELHYFLKNEVLEVDNFLRDVTGETFGATLRQAKVVFDIAESIITFLAQIEDFQKRLFEKKKFVVNTDYCITMNYVPEELYDSILRNDNQLDEWRELYSIDRWGSELSREGYQEGTFTRAFLDAYPHAIIDTRHFDQEFKDALLSHLSAISENGLSGLTSGLCIRGENFQTLNLLHEGFQGKIDCIHIDPPYNTDTSGFLYKNNYRHSSWLSMMYDRIAVGLPLLNFSGDFQCHIDENEQERLHMLLDQFQLVDLGTVVWDKKNPMLGKKGIATQHEYILWRSNEERSVYMRNTAIKKILSKANELIEKAGGVNDEVRSSFATWIREQEDLSGGEKAYRHIDDEGRVFQDVGMGAPEPRTDEKYFRPLIHPVTGEPCPVPDNGWSRAPETLQKLMEKGEIYFGEDESKQPRKKVYLTLESNRQLSSLVENRLIEEAKGGKSYLDSLDLEFPYSHPVSLYEEMLFAATDGSGIVLDHFAGSGTTGHAAISLNRAEGKGSGIQYVLVEMGDYFDSVLLPRLKKVAFSSEWKDGVPKRSDGLPHVIKYHQLESYEDALNNIVLSAPQEPQESFLYDQTDDYLLGYMLDFESKGSPSLLAEGAFNRPFDYKLNFQSDSEGPKPTRIDLVETFHYLLGLNVRSLQAYEHQGRRYVVSRGEVEEEQGVKQVLVIWRRTVEPELDLEVEAEWASSEVLKEAVDRVYVNSESYIENAEPIEITFRERMFSELHHG